MGKIGNSGSACQSGEQGYNRVHRKSGRGVRIVPVEIKEKSVLIRVHPRSSASYPMKSNIFTKDADRIYAKGVVRWS